MSKLMVRWLTAMGAVAAVSTMMAGGSKAHAQQGYQRDRDYPVTVGKITVPASQAERMKAMTPGQTSWVNSDRATTSTGQFVRSGKALVWVSNGQARPVLPGDPGVQIATASSLEKSGRDEGRNRGRFVQRGKAIIWVENDQPTPVTP